MPITGATTGTGRILDANGRVWQSWADTSTTAGNSFTLTTTGAATGDTWNQWADVTAITTSATTNHPVFVQWVTGTAGPSTIATNTITWGSWVNDTETGAHRTFRSQQYGHRAPPAPVDPAVRAAAEAQRLERRERDRIACEESERKRNAANKRAMDLLKSCLSPEQRHDFKEHGHFYVQAPSGRMYRIDKGSHGNVKCVDPVTKKWTESLCVAPAGGVPYGDAMLMQKLMIETAEEVFRSYANISYANGGRYTSGKRGRLEGAELHRLINLAERQPVELAASA